MKILLFDDHELFAKTLEKALAEQHEEIQAYLPSNEKFQVHSTISAIVRGIESEIARIKI